MLQELGDRPDVRAIVLGATGRGFNAGVDIKQIQSADHPHSVLIDANRGCFAAFAAVYECAVPVIAAVHGHCLGGGIGLVGNADVVIASDAQTTLGLVAETLGVTPGPLADRYDALATDLLRRVNPVLTLAIGEDARRDVVSRVWPEIAGGEESGPLGVPARHLDWAVGTGERMAAAPDVFATIIADLRGFLMPLVVREPRGEPVWPPGGPWSLGAAADK